MSSSSSSSSCRGVITSLISNPTPLPVVRRAIIPSLIAALEESWDEAAFMSFLDLLDGLLEMSTSTSTRASGCGSGSASTVDGFDGAGDATLHIPSNEGTHQGSNEGTYKGTHVTHKGSYGSLVTPEGTHQGSNEGTHKGTLASPPPAMPDDDRAEDATDAAATDTAASAAAADATTAAAGTGAGAGAGDDTTSDGDAKGRLRPRGGHAAAARRAAGTYDCGVKYELAIRAREEVSKGVLWC